MSNNLLIPIYLNKKIVIDLFTMMNSGFLKIEDQDNNSFSEENISNNLSVMRFSLNNEENIVTMTTLFSQLRQELIDREFLKVFNEKSDIENFNAGNFIEITATLSKNPLLQTFETFIEILDMALLFESFDQAPHNQNNQKKKTKAPSQLETILSEMKKFTSKISQANTLDILGQVNHKENNTKVVLPVEIDYFTNKTPTDLIDGEFKILGKIVKKVESPLDSSINLLRNTSIGLLPTKYINEFVTHLSTITSSGLEIPDIVTEVEGPALQIIPIAIYI